MHLASNRRLCWFLKLRKNSRNQIHGEKVSLSNYREIRKMEGQKKSVVKWQCVTEANPGETFVGSKKQAFRTMEYSKNLDREPFKPLRINYFRRCIIDYLREFIPQPPPHHHHPSVPYVQFVGGPHVLLHLNRKDIELLF